jgi:hypothetical protein
MKPIDISGEKQTNFIQVQIQTDDSFALLARKHINQLRDKFNGLLPQPERQNLSLAVSPGLPKEV